MRGTPELESRSDGRDWEPGHPAAAIVRIVGDAYTWHAASLEQLRVSATLRTHHIIPLQGTLS